MIQVDHVSDIRPGGRGCRTGIGIGLERGVRRHIAGHLAALALKPGDIVAIVLGVGVGVEAGALRRTQAIAGHPDETAWLGRVEPPVVLVAEAEIDAAAAIGAQEGLAFVLAVVKSYVVAPGGHPNAVLVARIAQYAGFSRRGKCLVFAKAEIAQSAALGKQHDPIIGNRDIGNRIAAAGALEIFQRGEKAGDEEFAAHIGMIEGTVGIDADRPNRIALVVASAVPGRIAEGLAAPHRIIEAHGARCGVAVDGKAPHPAAEIGDIPAGRVLGEIASGALGVIGAGIRIKGDLVQRSGSPVLHVEEAGAAGNAVVEIFKIGAAGSRNAMNEAGFEVGNEKLPIGAVIGDIAEAGAGIDAVIGCDDGEGAGLVIVVRAEAVDRAGAAIFAPHAGHPVRPVRLEVKAVGRGGGQIDGRFRGVVDGDAEDLPDLTGGDFHALGFVAPVLAARGGERIAQIDGAAADAGNVDDGVVLAVRSRHGEGAGKTGGEGLARAQGRNRFLRAGGR